METISIKLDYNNSIDFTLEFNKDQWSLADEQKGIVLSGYIEKKICVCDYSHLSVSYLHEILQHKITKCLKKNKLVK